MTIRALILSTTTALALAACGGNDDIDTDMDADVDATVSGMRSDTMTKSEPMMDMDGKDLEMTFPVKNVAGYEIGTITIEDEEMGVEIDLDMTSLPEGSLAVHFHENGTCDGPDFSSAGGHYNPAGVMHGTQSATGPHAGDMPNIDVPASGVLKTEIDNMKVSLSDRAGLAPLLDANGSAFIIHAKADDYESQPSGAAGARIACAVISR